MIRFRFNPFDNARSSPEMLAQLEIGAFFSEQMSVEDLVIDRDLAVLDYVRRCVPEEDQEAYLAEPEQSEGEMMDALRVDLMALARERGEQIGDSYPFEIVPPNTLKLRGGGNRSISLGYLVVQAMRLAQKNLIEIIANDANVRKTDTLRLWRAFERVFEYVAAYTLAGDRGGLPVVLSDCRRSLDLHRKLTGLCRTIGSGRVRVYSDWSPRQINSNDGGIDTILHVGGPAMPGNSYLVLGGATYQQKKIDGKIIGNDERQRFRDFFAVHPAVLHGALIRLADGDALTIEKCRLKDCLFYGYSDIVKYIGLRSADPAMRRKMQVIDSRLRQALEKLQAVEWQGDNVSYRIDAI